MPSYSRFSINLALNAFNILASVDLSDMEDRDLVNDSRLVKKGDIFAATIGHLSDGRDYVEKAVELGAELVLVQCENIKKHGKCKVKNKVTYIQFFELHRHLSKLANLYYQQPHNKLKIVGITGTNGKTTTSHIIAQLFEILDQSCAVIGTIGAGKLNALTSLINTTPGPTELNKLLNQFVKNGISHVAMEVSSHALDQNRLSPTMIDVAVFTNLSQDHFDYHHTMENYAQAKEKLFTHKKSQTVVINGDDKYAQQWLKTWSSQSTTFVYGLHKFVKNNTQFLYANNISHTLQGVEFTLETHLGNVDITSALIGSFNISNLLASAGVMLSQGFTLKQLAQAIKQCKPVNGRMELFTAPHLPTSVVDYAHTPNALENALLACKLHCSGNLHVVFGCGGDRDKDKRPLMGAIAEANADKVVLTNDNPRSESPKDITQHILAGCQFPENVTVTLSRENAVKTTIANASKDDMILFAGKGHEENIIINNKKMAYNERELVQSIYVNPFHVQPIRFQSQVNPSIETNKVKS